MGKYNDIDLQNWRNYTDIKTDSLWIFDRRDNSGLHDGFYHGNFIPQVPLILIEASLAYTLLLKKHLRPIRYQ